jgi:hypothetical protein
VTIGVQLLLLLRLLFELQLLRLRLMEMKIGRAVQIDAIQQAIRCERRATGVG